jgi:hypothetical protein
MNDDSDCPLCGALAYDQFRKPVVTDEMVERTAAVLYHYYEQIRTMKAARNEARVMLEAAITIKE